MRRLLLVVGVSLLAAALMPVLVRAATEVGVSATVTAQLVSVTVSDGSVAYGIVDLTGSKSTIDLSDSQTANNNGNVSADLDIKSSDGVGGVDWTLVAAAGLGGSDDFAHQFSINSGGDWTDLTTSYQALATGVAGAGSQVFDLKILMPTLTTDYVEKTITVTVRASAAA